MKGKTSLLFLLTSFILYILDIFSDIYVAFQYYKNAETWWCALTLAFVIVPHVIINTYAAYINVNFLWMSTRTALLMWILQLSTLASFKQEFTRWKREHWKCNGKATDEQHSADAPEVDYTRNKQYSADVTLTMHHSFLRLAEAFAESAPQCCLQNYIMVRQWRFPWYTIVSTIFSLLSLAWSITSLEISCKTCQWACASCEQSSVSCKECNPQWVEKSTKSFPKISLLVFFIAHLCLLVSRLTSLVIFAYVFRYYVFILVSFHWLLVFTAICVGKKFDLTTQPRIVSVTKRGLTLVLNASLRAYPMVFCLSSSISKLSFRKKISEKFRSFVYVFYGVLLLENTVTVLFAIDSEAAHINFLTKIVLPLVFAGFLLGVLFLVLYYRCYHPGKIMTENNAESLNNVTRLLKDTRNFEMTQVKYFVNQGTCYEDKEDDI
jgi:hypothetical protein